MIWRPRGLLSGLHEYAGCETGAFLESSGRRLIQVATEVGISPSEISRLKRELGRTRMERDVPKKAIGIFAELPR